MCETSDDGLCAAGHDGGFQGASVSIAGPAGTRNGNDTIYNISADIVIPIGLRVVLPSPWEMIKAV